MDEEKSDIEEIVEEKVQEQIEEEKEKIREEIKQEFNKETNNETQGVDEKVSRRKFLKMAGLGAGGLALSSSVSAIDWSPLGSGGGSSLDTSENLTWTGNQTFESEVLVQGANDTEDGGDGRLAIQPQSGTTQQALLKFVSESGTDKATWLYDENGQDVALYDYDASTRLIETSLGADNLIINSSLEVGGSVSVQNNSNLDMGNSRITSMSDPSNAQDAATKSWVENNSGSNDSSPWNLRRDDGNLTADYGEFIICDGGTVTLPTPKANAAVAVSNISQRISITSESGSVEQVDSIGFNNDNPVVFVSDGSNWYVANNLDYVFKVPENGIDNFSDLNLNEYSIIDGSMSVGEVSTPYNGNALVIDSSESFAYSNLGDGLGYYPKPSDTIYALVHSPGSSPNPVFAFNQLDGYGYAAYWQAGGGDLRLYKTDPNASSIGAAELLSEQSLSVNTGTWYWIAIDLPTSGNPTINYEFRNANTTEVSNGNFSESVGSVIQSVSATDSEYVGQRGVGFGTTGSGNGKLIDLFTVNL